MSFFGSQTGNGSGLAWVQAHFPNLIPKTSASTMSGVQQTVDRGNALTPVGSARMIQPAPSVTTGSGGGSSSLIIVAVVALVAIMVLRK